MATYRELLAKYQPDVIRSELQHEKALKQLNALLKQYGPHPPKAAGRLMNLLAWLIEEYEEREELYPIPNDDISPVDRLTHLMEARGLKQSEVADAAGVARATLSSILKGRRSISNNNAFRFAEFFDVPVVDFLEKTQSAVRGGSNGTESHGSGKATMVRKPAKKKK